MSQVSKEEFMKQITTELHRPVKRVFPRRSVHAEGKDDVFSMDLVDMSEWAKENDQHKFMLNVVDVFTRFAWSRPMTSKSAVDTFAAFLDIVKDRKPNKLWIDQGKEFHNTYFKKWCKQNNCVMYSTFGESKSVIVERFNRTLKTRMWKYFTENNTRRWVDILPKLMEQYNTSKHSSIKMSPTEASKAENQDKLQKMQNPPLKDKTGIQRKPRFDINDVVRISRIKGIFEKGYLPNWSQEVFTIIEIQIPYDPDEPIVYKLRDRHGEEIQGSFYEQELQVVKYPDIMLIEEVIKKKKIKNVNHVLVKFLGYPESMNSWIPESDLIDLKS